MFYVALDEPTKDDSIFRVDDFEIIINSKLCLMFSVVNIYFNTSDCFDDFKITTDFIWKDEYHYNGLIQN